MDSTGDNNKTHKEEKEKENGTHSEHENKHGHNHDEHDLNFKEIGSEIVHGLKEIPGGIVHGIATVVKGLDANRYATKKTIAQGMLDIALLTANASQLKYVLSVGHQHQFYTLMVTLISASIVLQVLVGVLALTLNLMRDCRLHDETYLKSAEFINHLVLGASVGITTTNLLIGAFDPALGAIAPGNSLDITVLQAVLYVMLGSCYDLNKTSHHKGANLWNNTLLALNLITVAINVIISGFDMRFGNIFFSSNGTEIKLE